MLGHAPRLKRYMPRSLFGRAFLILIVPILVLQGVVASVVVDRYYDGVTEQMVQVVASEMDFLVDQIEEAADIGTADQILRRVSKPLGIDLALDPEGKVEPQALRAFYDVTGGVIEETLKAGVSRPMTLDLLSVPKTVEARILTGKGVLTAEIPRRRLSPANPHQLVVLTTLAAIALAAIAALVMRNQVRPIRELAHAASAFGRGQSLPFRPAGAEEVRRAGQAFLDMRLRIERQIQQRTRMLTGVSHDLRTPLTRMKLALAMAEPGPETEELQRDVVEMEHMLDAFLAFARGEAGEKAEPVDAVTLVEEIARDSERAGASLSLAIDADQALERHITVRAQALKRAIVNLVDNARAYGGRIMLSLRMTPKLVEFTVEDDGPGIPRDKREEVMRPFARLDAARGQNIASGVGLGLSIALDIARSHGGALELDDSARLGGLRASIRLPR